MKTVAVCPEGNEFRVLQSGLSMRVVFLRLNTDAPIIKYDVPRIIVLST